MSGLTKSKILAGLHCEKALFLKLYNNQESVISSSTQRIFDEGHKVGALATSFYPEGSTVGHDTEPKLAIEQTKTLLQSSPTKPIFEATFEYEEVLIRADIFISVNSEFNLIEVKSTSNLKKYKNKFIQDCAIQTWVIEKNGLTLNKIEIAYINRDFIYSTGTSYRELFKYEDITDDVRANIANVQEWTKTCTNIANLKEEPTVYINSRCNRPNVCEFKAYCSPNKKYPVTSLHKGGKLITELLKEGIDDIQDIPADRLTNRKHIKMQKVIRSGQAEIDPRIAVALSTLKYPIYYIDFEAISMAIPTIENSKPYQQVPFQWSLHKEEVSGSVSHEEFLGITKNDPRLGFIESLISAIGNSGSIIVYSSFEKTQLKSLKRRYPELRYKINAIINRLVDLLQLVSNYYYHPDMHGSWSIKKVLPTIGSNSSYQALEVSDGSMAMSAYLEITKPNTDSLRRTKLTKDLLEYCKLDSQAMIDIVHYFKRNIPAPNSSN